MVNQRNFPAKRSNQKEGYKYTTNERQRPRKYRMRDSTGAGLVERSSWTINQKWAAKINRQLNESSIAFVLLEHNDKRTMRTTVRRRQMCLHPHHLNKPSQHQQQPAQADKMVVDRKRSVGGDKEYKHDQGGNPKQEDPSVSNVVNK